MRFLVIDQGIGIAPEDIPKLFTQKGCLPYGRQLNPNGVGLGLSICAQICKELNGDVWVKSQLGKGSTFGFSVEATEIKKTVERGDSYYLSS